MRLVANDIEVDVRAATEADLPELLSLIQSMAAFEKLEVTATEASLRDALFGASPVTRTLLAIADGKPVAYVTYFFTFATMIGRRCLWLDDLFVDAAFRGKGIGRALMAYLAEIALEHHCARFEWMVLDWNESAIGFYEKLGASILSEWRVCRLDEGQLPRLASQLIVPQSDAKLTDRRDS